MQHGCTKECKKIFSPRGIRYFREMKKTHLSAAVLSAVLLTGSATMTSCDILLAIAEEQLAQNAPLTQAEISNGLREALKVGIRNAVQQTSAENGYWGNEALRIAWPEDATKVKSTLENLGFSGLTGQFEESMNHAAEQASAEATDIFVDAITKMTITDALNILQGEHDAATTYLRGATEAELTAKFRPVIDQAMANGQVTQLWGQITTRYNQIPLVKPVETDLTGYITKRALDGLFQLVAEEEAEIRENPAARVNDILQRVFSSPEAQTQNTGGI